MINEIKYLINSDVTGYKIFQKTGISQSVVSELRNGKRDIENLSLKTAEKLYDFYKDYELNVIYKEVGHYLKDNEHEYIEFGLYNDVYDYADKKGISINELNDAVDQSNFRLSEDEPVLILKEDEQSNVKVVYISHMSQPVDILKELQG